MALPLVPPPEIWEVDDSRRIAICTDALEVRISERLGGDEILEFSLPADSAAIGEVRNERVVRFADRRFRIRVHGPSRRGDEVRYAVTAEALWYDLGAADLIPSIDEPEATALGLVREAVRNTDWEAATAPPTTPTPFRGERLTPLALIREVEKLFHLEAVFRTAERTVHLRPIPTADEASQRPVHFRAGKNLTEVRRQDDSRTLVTRLWAFGANGLTVAPANNGVPYVEDYSWFTSQGLPAEVRVGVWEDPNITSPFVLLDQARFRLAAWSRPLRNFEASVVDLSRIDPAWEDEEVQLGDVVRIYDEAVAVDYLARVVSREWWPYEPERTRIELETLRPALSELLDLNRLGAQARDEVQRAFTGVTFLNLLLNSRGDQGLAYWDSDGFEVVPEGVSGRASFHCQAAFGQRRSLAQVVRPATRPAYALSFEVASQDLVRGAGSRVGVEVVVRYADGSEETQFFSL